MKYKIGDQVVINSHGFNNYYESSGIDINFLYNIPGKIIGITKDNEYPYMVEFPTDVWVSKSSGYCKVSGEHINFNGSHFHEDELEILNTKKEIMNKDFKISDRIYFNGNQDTAYIDDYGTVVRVIGDGVYVEFDHKIEGGQGHSCNGKAKDGYGWFISKSNFGFIQKTGKMSDITSNDLDISKYDAIMDNYEKSKSDVQPTVSLLKKRSKNVGFQSIPIKSTI